MPRLYRVAHRNLHFPISSRLRREQAILHFELRCCFSSESTTYCLTHSHPLPVKRPGGNNKLKWGSRRTLLTFDSPSFVAFSGLPSAKLTKIFGFSPPYSPPTSSSFQGPSKWAFGLYPANRTMATAKSLKWKIKADFPPRVAFAVAFCVWAVSNPIGPHCLR